MPNRNTQELKDRLVEYMDREGLRSTAQRRLVSDIFFKSIGHLSIEDMLEKVRAIDQGVGYATVYRTLKLLKDSGLAFERHFGDGISRYEVADEGEHHDHLICMKCGLILEFENHEIEELQDSVAEKLGGFKIMTHKLELYGLCPKAMGVPGGSCPDESGESLGKHSRPTYQRLEALRDKP